MNASQSTSTSTRYHRRACRVIAAATVVVALGALPASARQDPGQIDPAPASSTAVYFCPLERVATQFVACDNLTGNGVPAPVWVPER